MGVFVIRGHSRQRGPPRHGELQTEARPRPDSGMAEAVHKGWCAAVHTDAYNAAGRSLGGMR